MTAEGVGLAEQSRLVLDEVRWLQDAAVGGGESDP
jgi:hypothetical protein